MIWGLWKTMACYWTWIPPYCDMALFSSLSDLNSSLTTPCEVSKAGAVLSLQDPTVPRGESGLPKITWLGLGEPPATTHILLPPCHLFPSYIHREQFVINNKNNKIYPWLIFLHFYELYSKSGLYSHSLLFQYAFLNMREGVEIPHMYQELCVTQEK